MHNKTPFQRFSETWKGYTITKWLERCNEGIADGERVFLSHFIKGNKVWCYKGLIEILFFKAWLYFFQLKKYSNIKNKQDFEKSIEILYNIFLNEEIIKGNLNMFNVNCLLKCLEIQGDPITVKVQTEKIENILKEYWILKN